MPLILGTNSIKDTGFNVANSLRFDSGSSTYLTKGSLGTGSTTKATFSAWIKKSKLSPSQDIYSLYLDNDNQLRFRLRDNGAITIYISLGNVVVLEKRSTLLLRDFSAWYHVCLVTDLTQSTSEDKYKIYINNEKITSYAVNTNTSATSYSNIVAGGGSYVMHIGSNGQHNDNFYSGYMAEVVHIDGQALDPTSFGEFDEDSPTIWKPIDVSGLTFGTNGFYLDFEDSSALGNDAGGSNNFTVGNLAAIDQSTDTCTNNFCTWNPLIIRTGRTAVTFSEGNLKAQHNDTGGNTPSWGTFLLNSGKWYWEVKITSAGIVYCGVWQPGYNDGDVSDSLNGIVVYRTDGNKQAETAGTAASYGNSFTTGDILGIAVDVDTGTIWFSKNGTWQNSATISEIAAGTTTNSAYTGKSFATNGILPSVSAYQQSGNAIVEANFGGGTSFSISSGNADANGFGNFEYAVPSGYYSLNTKNLAEFG